MKKSLVDTICILAIVTVTACTTTTRIDGFVVVPKNESPLPTASVIRTTTTTTTTTRTQCLRSLRFIDNNHQRTNTIVNSNDNNDLGYNVMGRRKTSVLRLAAKNQKSPEDSGDTLPTELPASNEFSRTVPTDRILKTRKSTTGSISNSFYPVSIEANEIECVALARRFDLSSISNLSASLQLRPSSLNTGGISSNSIEVEGMCQSIVTQRCVRTNEDFEVALEFPIYCIVRPVQSSTASSIPDLSAATGSYQDNNSNSIDKHNGPQQRKSNGANNNNNNNKKSYRLPDRNIDEMDVMELQRLLQADITADDDTLMEDEAIYTLQDGQMDLGELVAQLFWFKLDPYPKKPGTDPIQRSITG